MMYKQGDVLLIPIPFSDLKSSKKRPVIVLSNSYYNSRTEDIVVAAVTSNLQQKEYAVMFSNEDMLEGVLKVDSCIRLDKIYTLSQYIVVNRFGRVKEEVLDKVKQKINVLMDES